MFPTLNIKQTGIQLRRLMDRRGLSVKDIQQYLGLGSVQSVYHWLNGLSMPTIDNLYALSELLQVPVDAMLCGNRRYKPTVETLYEKNRIPVFESVHIDEAEMRMKRMQAYYVKLNELWAA